MLKQLSKDKSIIITKPDKGRGVVVQDKKENIDKTEEILSDGTKFKVFYEYVFKCITRLEDKLNRLLRSLKLKITEEL